MTLNVLCLGEVMVELSLDGADSSRAAIGVAGDTFNTAIYLKRQAPEFAVSYGTKIGTDRFSDMILDALKSEAISTDAVLFSETHLPGLYAISTDEAGERSFLYWRDNAAYRTLFEPPQLDLASLSGFDVIYYSAISIAVLPQKDRERFLNWLPSYRANGGLVAFDSNYRPRLWTDRATAQTAIKKAWECCDIAMPSVDDEMALFGDANETAVIARLASWGAKSGTLKRGAEGPRPLGDGPAPQVAPAPRVIDSTAAGDSFNAGYLAARLKGQTETKAMAAGHALAAQVVQHRGAILPRNKKDLT